MLAHGQAQCQRRPRREHRRNLMPPPATRLVGVACAPTTPATISSRSTSSQSPHQRTLWSGPWLKPQTTKLQHLYTQCRTWSGASLCASCTALDHAEFFKKERSHMSVVMCVLPSFPDCDKKKSLFFDWRGDRLKCCRHKVISAQRLHGVWWRLVMFFELCPLFRRADQGVYKGGRVVTSGGRVATSGHFFIVSNHKVFYDVVFSLEFGAFFVACQKNSIL